MSFVRILVNSVVYVLLAVGMLLQGIATACYMRGDE